MTEQDKESVSLKNLLAAGLAGLCINLPVYGLTFSANTYSAQDLPLIHRLLDPALYPGDLYVETIRQFPSVFIYLMAGLARLAPLPAVYTAVYLAVKILFFACIYGLAERLLRDRTAAAAAVVLTAVAPLCNSVGLLGGVPVIHAFLYHTSFGIALAVCALYLFTARKYIVSFVVLSAALFVSALPAVHLSILLAFGTVILLRAGEQRRPLLTGWAVFLVALGIYAVLILPDRPDPQQARDFIVFLRQWHPEHYFFAAWPPAQVLRGLAYIGFFLAVIIRGVKEKRLAQVFGFLGAVGVMWIVAGVSARLQWPDGIMLQLFRSDIYLILLGVIYAAGWIAEKIAERKPAPVLIGILGILFLADYHLSFRTAAVCATGAALILAALFLKAAAPANPPDKNAPVLVLILAVGLLPFTNVLVYRAGQGSLAYREPLKQDWHDVQFWARDNTPKAARFLTPPYFNGFRVFSERSAFVERLDGGFAHWSPGILGEWQRRLGELGYANGPPPEFDFLNPRDPGTVRSRIIYGALDGNRAAALGRKYRLDYIVTENGQTLGFPLAYQNRSFNVYRLP